MQRKYAPLFPGPFSNPVKLHCLLQSGTCLDVILISQIAFSPSNLCTISALAYSCLGLFLSLMIAAQKYDTCFKPFNIS